MTEQNAENSGWITVSTSDESLRSDLPTLLGAPAKADSFFNRFSSRIPMYATMQEPFRHPASAYQLGVHLMNRCFGLDDTIDKSLYREICKSTGFYWLGMQAMLINDFESATFFMDAALHDEVRERERQNGKDLLSDPTPTVHFLLLQGEPEDQAARKFVQGIAAKAVRLLNRYNEVGGLSGEPPMGLEDVRARFLAPAIVDHAEWRTAVTTFISYVVEWDYRNTLIDLRLGPGTSEPFFMHLSKGCALFETLLRFQVVGDPKNLQTILGAARLRKRMGLTRQLDINARGVAEVIAKSLGSKNDFDSVIETAGQLRNCLLHNLRSDDPLSKREYDMLFHRVGMACLRVIAKLYDARSSDRHSSGLTALPEASPTPMPE